MTESSEAAECRLWWDYFSVSPKDCSLSLAMIRLVVILFCSRLSRSHFSPGKDMKKSSSKEASKEQIKRSRSEWKYTIRADTSEITTCCSNNNMLPRGNKTHRFLRSGWRFLSPARWSLAGTSPPPAACHLTTQDVTHAKLCHFTRLMSCCRAAPELHWVNSQMNGLIFAFLRKHQR